MKENKTIQNILDIISIQDSQIKRLQERVFTLEGSLDNLKQKYNK